MQNSNSGFAPVNGLNLYYEIHGEGQPLIMLHGGVAASEAFGQNLTDLAKARKVIALHLQAHGHTKDIDRPLRSEFMADDVAALMALLKIEKADVLGYSLGGGVALQTAIRHPAAVDRLIVVRRKILAEPVGAAPHRVVRRRNVPTCPRGPDR